uniref:Uncharacterized protein n=1 Tax=Oncorhynchus tshawytscha TaxID=74940 RepID=A0A8C8FBE7_ONCTS
MCRVPLLCFIFGEDELHCSKWLGFKLQTERLGSEQQAANVKISPHYTPLYCFSATQFVLLSKPFPTNNGSFCMRQPAATQKLKGFYYNKNCNILERMSERGNSVIYISNIVSLSFCLSLCASLSVPLSPCLSLSWPGSRDKLSEIGLLLRTRSRTDWLY